VQQHHREQYDRQKEAEAHGGMCAGKPVSTHKKPHKNKKDAPCGGVKWALQPVRTSPKSLTALVSQESIPAPDALMPAVFSALTNDRWAA
jgi:hypothetical protein